MPAATLATPAAAAPLSTFGVDATQLGVRAGGGADQSNMLQAAIDKTAGARVPLMLGPGDYRVGGLTLPSGTQLIGVRGATRLIFTGGSALISARGADHVTLAGLMLDGGGQPLPENGALVAFRAMQRSPHHGLRDHRLRPRRHPARGRRRARSRATPSPRPRTSRSTRSTRAGLTIQNNIVRGAGNGGILVHRSTKGDDGTLVLDNRIEDIANVCGGSGQYGNAINVFRAGNVIVRGNRISRAAYSAVRGNAASNIQITGNTATDMRRGRDLFGVRLRGRGDRQQHGRRRGARHRRSCNFNEGGRLAVVQGNMIRNLKAKRPVGTDPDDAARRRHRGRGRCVGHRQRDRERAGRGHHGRLGRLHARRLGGRQRGAQRAASASPSRWSSGAGTAVIAGNLISGSPRGAIVGMDHAKAVTGDLSEEPARYANLQISGNRVR